MTPHQDNDTRLFRDEGLEEETQPGYTYKMHIMEERIEGHTDGRDALEQAIYKEIQTEPGLIIYTRPYGVKKLDLFGKPKPYAYMILTHRIKKALMDDDRILDVYDFYFHKDLSVKADLVMSFSVDSIFGEIKIREVNLLNG